jgi:hypothetical protein
VEYSNYLSTIITNNARGTREMKSRIAMAKAAFNEKNLFIRKLDSNLSVKPVKCCVRSIALYGAETWTFREVDQKHLESFEMCYCRRMGEISWTDRVSKEEVLHRVKEERNIIHTVKRRKGNWIGHMSCRNCFLEYVVLENIKGKIEVTTG